MIIVTLYHHRNNLPGIYRIKQYYILQKVAEIYSEIHVIFIQITVNQQQNDADITIIYCSCFTVNSHDEVVFNHDTVRKDIVFDCNCFEHFEQSLTRYNPCIHLCILSLLELSK